MVYFCYTKDNQFFVLREHLASKSSRFVYEMIIKEAFH